MRWKVAVLAFCLGQYVQAEPAASSYSVFFKSFKHQESFITAIPATCTLKKIELEAEEVISLFEVTNLLDIREGQSVSREHLLKGIDRLGKKEKCIKAVFTFIPEQNGMVLRIALTFDWTIKTINFKGVFSEKHEFYRLYELLKGDIFLPEKHEHSVDMIRLFLKEQGYEAAVVTDEVVKDEKTKTVTITITIHKGKVFRIDYVAVSYVCPEGFITDIQKHVLHKKCIKKLVGKVCIAKHVNYAKESILSWLHDEGFFDAEVVFKEIISENTHGVDLKCIITMKQKKQLSFAGNRYFSKKELKQKIASCVLSDVFLPTAITSQELITDYHKKGFWSVQIDSKEEKNKETFVIQEGVRIAIKKVIVKGVTSYQGQWLSKEFFKEVKHTKFFDEDKVDAAISNLMSWYRKQGFWDVALLKKEYVPLEKKNAHALLVTLDEGKQHFISGVYVKGYFGTLAELPSYLKIMAHEEPVPFSSDLIGQQRTYLTKQLRNQGYVHARLSYTLKEQDTGTELIWNCDQGKQVTFGKTIMLGYTTVSYDRILKMMQYQEGDVWSKEKLQTSLANLRSLDIFERVSVYPSLKDLASDERDTMVMVKDDDPYEVRLRMGYAQVSKNLYFKKGSTYKLGGSFILKNPLKKADRLSIDTDFTLFERKCSISYKVPFLFDIPVKTIFKAYSNKYIQPIAVGSLEPLYEVVQQGFLMGISKRVYRCDIGLTSGFEWMETTDISPELARAMNFKPDLLNKKIPYFFIEPMMYADFLNDKLNPTQGFFALCTIKGMFPFEQSSFLVKFLAEQGTFIPAGPFTAMVKFRVGHIFRRVFSAIMPPERFYLGGPNSLRSYQPDKCPPLGVYKDCDGKTQYVPQGGKTMLNINLEARLPIKGNNFWGILFQDFGILVEDPQELIHFRKTLAATGLGLRYVTPVGPLRFDIGWKWGKDRPEESSYAWFLTFGNAF